jgi:energy-coupling factor transporter ATP-binding protein EcfA2
MWVIEKIEISGGFLPGLSATIPQGLTCIIGARGSGRSTLVEAVRFALCGISAAPKHCADLIQANLGGGALVTITALADGSNRYTIKRSLKQNPVLLTSDSRAINTVDLDRGTFLPLDAYSSIEIEAIADEALGDRRRNLLDELRSEQMRSIQLSLAESTRALETNADRIRTAQRTIDDLTEQVEELGDVRVRLSALAPSDRESAEGFVRLSRQQQLDQREIAKLDSADRDLKMFEQTLERLRTEAQNVFVGRLAEEQSANTHTLRRYDKLLAASMAPVEEHLSAIQTRIREAQDTLAQATSGRPHFKDASDLSRGQKCTALLPILLARRDNPLIIDQPEDNLDNHFIFETVVNAVQRMKKRRQMIFITHNANIPVLAEAELVLVMTSDGRIGAIEKSGSVDECREQIIDLLEGGREAFELRSKRYAAG